MRTTSDDPAARQRPPLTKRLRPWHWAALDYLAGALTTVVLFTELRHGLARDGFPPPFGTPHIFSLPLTGSLGVLLVAAAGFAVALRRRHPVLMLGVLLAGAFVASTLTVADNAALAYFVPVAYVLYLVAATYEERRDAVRVLVAVCATLFAVVLVLKIGRGGTFNGNAMIPVALLVIIAWTIGHSVRQRRRYAVRLQDEAASKAVAQERLRIARELHDVVAHSMSVIAVQAGYGQYVIDTQPGDASKALGAIQATSREALDEMRRMLGALRHAEDGDVGAGLGAGGSGSVPAGGPPADGVSGTGAPLFPAPGLAELDRLISRTAGAGVQVEVKRLGRPRDLPPGIDLSAYRIVQEALTNVVKHAQTHACQVLIDYEYDLLTIEITDNGAGVLIRELAGAGASHHGAAHAGSAPLSRHGSAARGLASPPGEGHGIIGMRERVTLLGGEFSAGPLPGYGFRVSARIPLPVGPA